MGRGGIKALSHAPAIYPTVLLTTLPEPKLNPKLLLLPPFGPGSTPQTLDPVVFFSIFVFLYYAIAVYS